MAAFRLGTAVEGKSQQGPGGRGMVPPPRLLAANRREEAVNGGGARSVVGALRPKKFPPGKPRKQRALIWQAAVFSSVALNVALLLHHFVFSDQLEQKKACLVHPEAVSGGKSGAQGQKGAVLTRAPSTGKPAVTSDSVINLDQ
jgi:L-tryptophan---pyruvate aminotransferase